MYPLSSVYGPCGEHGYLITWLLITRELTESNCLCNWVIGEGSIMEADYIPTIGILGYPLCGTRAVSVKN